MPLLTRVIIIVIHPACRKINAANVDVMCERMRERDRRCEDGLRIKVEMLLRMLSYYILTSD